MNRKKKLSRRWIYRLLYKSDNLQYNTPACWVDGTNDSSTKGLMFQVLFFFMISCKILCKNPFNLFSYFFYKITKIKIKSFECPKSIKSIKKIILGTSDSWSTIRLYHRPSQPSVLYCRLTDFLTPQRHLILETSILGTLLQGI